MIASAAPTIALTMASSDAIPRILFQPACDSPQLYLIPVVGD